VPESESLSLPLLNKIKRKKIIMKNIKTAEVIDKLNTSIKNAEVMNNLITSINQIIDLAQLMMNNNLVNKKELYNYIINQLEKIDPDVFNFIGKKII